MDKLVAMTAFVRIVEAGSLTAAADTLDASLPTVVRTLAALERHLGVSLLKRTTRRIHLTDEGAQYLERCRVILSALQDGGEAYRDRVGAVRTTLRGPDRLRFRPPSSEGQSRDAVPRPRRQHGRGGRRSRRSHCPPQGFVHGGNSGRPHPTRRVRKRALSAPPRRSANTE